MFSSRTIAVALLAASFPYFDHLGVAGHVVDLGYAKYDGAFNSTTNITHFYGIRYAAPPIGPLRFSAPHPPLKSKRVIKADTRGAECLQSESGLAPETPFKDKYTSSLPFPTERKTDYGFSVGEDCLFLDVYHPRLPPPAPHLPVVVYIHGGGYSIGGTNGMAGVFGPNDGSDLIRIARGNVIVVNIQYRLGLFGFLAGKKFKLAGGALNAGLLDQEFALKWVQEHIHKFGGDKNQVTIWGSSAGAGSVLQQLMAHRDKSSPSLVHAAITNSAFLPSQYPYNGDIPEARMFHHAISTSHPMAHCRLCTMK